MTFHQIQKHALKMYGGQAVIEGVMMRGTTSVAIAMRAPDQGIVIHKETLGSLYHSGMAKAPFIRGLVALWDALNLGIRALTISANTQTGEDEKIEGAGLFFALIISLSFAVGLFFLAPAALAHLVEAALSINAWIGNLIEGVIRLAILVGYIWVIGRIPDIRRVFAYHGAEHKTINAFEAGADLTPDSVSHFSVEHPRCGTAFLLTVVFLSILVFSFFGPMGIINRLVLRVLLIPVISSLAYEYIRWSSKHLEKPFVRWLIKPNLALQRLTTREPSLDMIEVAIAAFNSIQTESD